MDFMKIVRGRYPLSDNPGSARFWTPHNVKDVSLVDKTKTPIESVGNFVPRPDRDIWYVQLLSFFGGLLGADHFYLRSPVTGILKMITFGGFLLWWIWDMLQVTSEKERVLAYGMSLPFDAKTGIGQGMIYEGKSQYNQQTSYSAWSVASLFGFTGVDMMMIDRFWLGVRKLLVVLFTMSSVTSVVKVGVEQGVGAVFESMGFFKMLWTLFLGSLFVGVGMMWFNDVKAVLGMPDTIMSEGLKPPKMSVDILGWIKKFYVDPKLVEERKASGKPFDELDTVPKELRASYEAIKEHYMFSQTGIPAKELRSRFWIAHGTNERIDPPTFKTDAGIPPVNLLLRIGGEIWSLFNDYIFKPIGNLLGVAANPYGAILDKLLGKVEPILDKVAGVKGLAAGLPGGLAAGLPGGLAAGLPGGLAAGLPGGLAAGAAGLSKGLPVGLAAAAIPGLSSVVPDVTKGIQQGLSSVASDVTKMVPDVTKMVPDVTKMVPAVTKMVPSSITDATRAIQQAGGAIDPLSTEAKILGGATIALIAGGAVKGLVDYMMDA